MAYNFKMNDCPSCKKVAKKDFCRTCIGLGKLVEERPYLPWLAVISDCIISDTELKDLKKSFVHTLTKTSIRLREGTKVTSGWNVYPGAPTYSISDERRLSQGGSFKQPGRRNMDFIIIPQGDTKYTKLLELVPRISEIYKDIEVTELKCDAKCTYYIVNVRGVGSSYCNNIAGNHRSRSIYFFLDKSGLSQKCYCRCNTTVGRKTSFMCKNYRSRPYVLLDDVHFLFFNAPTHGRDKSLSSLFNGNDTQRKIDLSNKVLMILDKNDAEHAARESRPPSKKVKLSNE